jgi:hypothetical protein
MGCPSTHDPFGRKIFFCYRIAVYPGAKLRHVEDCWVKYTGVLRGMALFQPFGETCEVVATFNTQRRGDMKYLVAVDGSEHARKAMDLACRLASGREADEVVLLTVVDEYSASDILDEDMVLAAGNSPP